MPTYLKTKAEYEEALKNEKVVIDFTATWCGPCKTIAPVFEKFASEYEDIFFYKIDVDENEEVAELEEVSKMPTFKFYHNGTVKDVFSGANEDSLKGFIDS